MQNAGSLKKKKKRCLNKIAGLSQAELNTKYDNFNINLIYNFDDIVGATINENVDLENDNGGMQYSNPQLPEASRVGSTLSRRTREPWQPPPPAYDEAYFATSSHGSRAHSAVGSTRNLFGESKSKMDQPCLISKKASMRLHHICILGACVWALPWTYNKKECRIDRWSPGIHRVWQFVWFIFAIQNAILLQYQFYAFMTKTQLDNGSYRPLFMNSFCVFWYLYSITLNTTMHLYREKFRIYINTMLDMNRTYVDRYVIHLDGLVEQGQAILRYTIPCNFTQLGLCVMFFLKFPFQPWYLYSYIYKPENPWYWLIPGALQEWVMAGQTISVFCLLGWITVCHGNSVNFWLQESHNNFESENTRDDIREPQNCVSVYRALQILTGLLNDCISPIAYPLMKLVNFTALISCGYVLIRSMNQKMIDEFPAILTYPFGFIICTTCTYGMLQTSAEMYDLATSFLDSWCATKSRNLRRVLTSCRTLRVNVSWCYYVTTSTTITYFQQTYDYIIDLIITFP